MSEFPTTQHAVQLVGADSLRLNTEKSVPSPSGHQILARVEATGLCFSDLKLLKQFTQHPRKGEIIADLPADALAGNPSYVPGDAPTVPGHESVVRIVAIGDQVRSHRVGERCLVQTDYRALKTAAGSNAAFGYNLEGGLQEFVLIDERVTTDPETGERYLIPVGEEKSASAIALVEPWACVEDSYQNVERRAIKPGGRLLVVAEAGHTVAGLADSLSPSAPPASVVAVCADDASRQSIERLGVSVERRESIENLADQGFDDIVYFGAGKAALESLNAKIANGGIVNVVTGGKRIGAPVAIGVGRMHYGMTRWVGTLSANAADGYRMIPETGEIRSGDSCLVMGAGGPMGQMHVVRNICAGAAGLSVTATDFDTPRLESLEQTAAPFAQANGVALRTANPQTDPVRGPFTYVAIMVPVPQLVAEAISLADEGCLINIFAGIPAPTIHQIDLDAVIAKRCFLFGTSGSTLHDMKVVLEKVESGTLDTNCSVGAVSGMAGAIDGIAAVEHRTLPGKIIVYPALRGLPLIPLDDLPARLPAVAAKLDDGRWTKAAEEELLREA